MKEIIKLICKGFVIGLGKIIPGVSGAMLAISMGIYEKGLNAISNICSEFRKNFKFLFCLGIGIIVAIVIGSKMVVYCLNKFYLPTMLLFIGMIVGGIKPLFQEIKEYPFKLKNFFIGLITVIILFVVSVLDFGHDKTTYIKNISSFSMFFFGGVLDAAATVIPGISGTALLMILGYYNIIMNSFSDIFNLTNLANNMFVLIPFCLGTLFGVIIISKIMNYLFNHYKVTVYYAITGFACVSVLMLLSQTFNRLYSVLEIIISLILFAGGYFVAQELDK